MKTRNGFVSNSSSSSFTCDVCGHNVAGYDMSFEDICMWMCSAGHYFCDSHKLDISPTVEEMREELILGSYPEEKKEPFRLAKDEDIPKLFEEFEFNEGGTARYETMKCWCPVCQITSLPPKEMLKYLLVTSQKTKQEVCAEIKEKYGDYQSFRKAMKETKQSTTQPLKMVGFVPENET